MGRPNKTDKKVDREKLKHIVSNVRSEKVRKVD